MLGELNKDQIEQVLQTQAIGRIGIHADERRYVVPVTYVFDKDSVYAHLREGLKIRMMRKNPRVPAVVFRIKLGEATSRFEKI